MKGIVILAMVCAVGMVYSRAVFADESKPAGSPEAKPAAPAPKDVTLEGTVTIKGDKAELKLAKDAEGLQKDALVTLVGDKAKDLKAGEAKVTGELDKTKKELKVTKVERVVPKGAAGMGGMMPAK